MSQHSSAENDAPVAWALSREDARDLLRFLRHNRPLGMPDRTLNGLADALIAAGRDRIIPPVETCGHLDSDGCGCDR